MVSRLAEIPRVAEALLLHARYTLHAGIDISDGLSLDLDRLTKASRCGAMLDARSIPVSPAARELAALQRAGRTPLEHALSDGEDFELLLAVPPEDAARLLRDQPLAGVPLTQIGTITAEPGLRIIDEGLLILGWVALWRPLDILLFDRFEMRASIKTLRRLAVVPVEVRFVE